MQPLIRKNLAPRSSHTAWTAIIAIVLGSELAPVVAQSGSSLVQAQKMHPFSGRRALLVAAEPPPQGAQPRELRAKYLARWFDAVDTDDRAKRQAAIKMIRGHIDERDIEGVAEAATDKRIRVREAAIDLLDRFRGHSPAEPPDIHGILLANLRHENPRFRLAAACTAQHFAGDSDELRDALVAALDDHAFARPADKQEGLVSEYAALSLGEIGAGARPAHAALLRAAAKSKRREVRNCALYAIGSLATADERERPRLLAFLIRRLERGETAFDRTAAARGLRNMGPAAAPALPALRKAYRCEGVKGRKDRTSTRKMIVETYIAVGRDARVALPDLLPALQDKKEGNEFRGCIAIFAWTLEQDGKAAWPIMQRIVADVTEDLAIKRDIYVRLSSIGAKK